MTFEYKNGEYWVYISPGAYQIRIKTNSNEPLMLNFKDYNLAQVESKTTYELTFRYQEYDWLVMADHKIIQGPNLKKYALSILTLPYGWTIGGLSTLDYMKRLAAIIARDGEYLVFVEVKLRKTDSFAAAREFVDHRKQNRIRTTASVYLSQNPTELQPRFDVIEIYAPEGTATKKPIINHLEDAFQ